MPKFLRGFVDAVKIKPEVHLSRQGGVRVDSSQLVNTEEVKQQIGALDRLIKNGRIKIQQPHKK